MLHMNKEYRIYWRLHQAAKRLAESFSVTGVAFAHGSASSIAIERLDSQEELDRYLILVNTLADQRYKEIGYD